MLPCQFDEVLNDKVQAAADTDEVPAVASSTNYLSTQCFPATTTTNDSCSINWGFH